MSSENAELASPTEVVIREKTSLVNNSKSKNNLDELDAEHQVNSLTEINNGDHLIITLNQTSFCHVILEKFNVENETIDIIYFDDTKTQCSLDEYIMVDDASKLEKHAEATAAAAPVCRKVGVKKSTVLIDLKKVDLYKVDYGPNECLIPDETIAKARMFLKYWQSVRSLDRLLVIFDHLWLSRKILSILNSIFLYILRKLYLPV